MDRATAFKVDTKDAILSYSSQNEPVLDTPEKILSFGEEATRGISKFADEILSQFSLSYTEDSSKLLGLLNELMSRFNREDFIKNLENKGFFAKLIHRTKKSVEEVYDKYSAFSKEIDRIFISVKKYELEIKDTNDMLDRMYEENKHFYAELEKYIHSAISYIENNINPYILELEEKLSRPDSGYAQIELGRYRQIKELIEQRVYDLELAKAVSLQTAPQIKLIQKGNYNLIRKISSAFVITMPLFKQGIIQAITAKRQKLHMDSMKALDESTNKLLVQNAHNIIENTKLSVMANQNSAVKVESLVESYNTIINGIKEIEVLQEENKKQRIESLKKLEEYKVALLTGKPIALDDKK